MRIEPLQPRAIVQVEARHRVALGRGRQVQQVGRAQRQQRGRRFLVQLVVRGRALQRGQVAAAQPAQVLARRFEVGGAVAAQVGQRGEVGLAQQPGGKPGTGDSVQKVLMRGSSRCNCSATLLIRKLPSDTLRSPGSQLLML